MGNKGLEEAELLERDSLGVGGQGVVWPPADVGTDLNKSKPGIDFYGRLEDLK